MRNNFPVHPCLKILNPSTFPPPTACKNKIEEIFLDPLEALKSKGNNASYLLETQFNREKIIEKITGYLVEG